MLVHRQVPLTVCRCSFMLLGGEMHCVSLMPYSRIHNNDPVMSLTEAPQLGVNCDNL